MKQFDSFPIQCRHIEHMHEGVCFRKNFFYQNDSCENLYNFSLLTCLYMHRWCLHRLINSYHSFWWNNLILNNFYQNDSCENLDNFSLLTCLYMHRWCLHRLINSYHSFWWNNLILFLYNVNTLNICMKEFGSEKIIFAKMTAVRT